MPDEMPRHLPNTRRTPSSGWGLLAALLLTTACSKSVPDSDDTGPVASDTDTPTVVDTDVGEGSLRIDVIGWGAHPVFTGTITIGDQEQAIVLGRAIFTGLPAGEVRGIVRAPGFVTANVLGSVITDQSTVAQALLLPVGVSIDFPADQPADLYHNDIGVHLDANSFVDAQGALVTGTITAHLTRLDPVTDQPAAPGPYEGMGTTGEMTLIESFGMADFSFEANGSPIQLGTGNTATIELGIPPSFEVTFLETIPAWSYDLEQGHWIEEGSGYVTGVGERLYWQATVSHFTYWNADRVMNETECVIVELPFTYATASVPIFSEGIDYSGVHAEPSDDDGMSCIEFKRGGRATIHAGSGSHGFTYSQNIVGSGDPADCDFDGGSGCTTLLVQVPELSCVRGTVNESGVAAEDVLVLIGFGQELGLATTDVNGGFCSQVPTSNFVTAYAFAPDLDSFLTAEASGYSGETVASCGVPELCTDLGVLEVSESPQYCLDGQATQDLGVNNPNDPVPTGTPLFVFREDTFSGINCSTTAASWGVVVAEGTIGADGGYCVTLPLAENSRDLVFVADSCNRATCNTDLATPICSDTEPFTLVPGAELGFAGGFCGGTTDCIDNDLHFAF